MIKDEAWPVARLIPITSASGVEAQERRAASALLAVIAAVNEFGRGLLKPLGAPAGKIETFIEVPFKTDAGTIRPDGVITVAGRGGKTWTALVETKVGSSELEARQMEAYLDLARDLKMNAVLSISNHYVTSSAVYPIDLDKRKLRKVALHHWSWVDVLTQAVVQKEHRGVSDPDQAYILDELIRYLSDPRSGALGFDNMGPSWTSVRDDVRQHRLRKTDSTVDDVISRWDDLVRYLALELTKDLGRDVRQVLGPNERSAASRQQALRDSLAETGRLFAELRIPDAAGPLEIISDLRSRQVFVSSKIDPPKDAKSKGRISWLVRQLANTPESVTVETKISRSSESLAESLGQVRQTPESLIPSGGREIRQFVITQTRNMGMKRDASKGSFIESVVTASKDFYADVLQNLRTWKPRPPRLKRPEEDDAVTDVPASEGVSKALDDAQTEMEESIPQAKVREVD
jgi:hypothetical protein